MNIENSSYGFVDSEEGKEDDILSPYVQLGICFTVFVGNTLILMALKKAKGLKHVTCCFIGKYFIIN